MRLLGRWVWASDRYWFAISISAWYIINASWLSLVTSLRWHLGLPEGHRPSGLCWVLIDQLVVCVHPVSQHQRTVVGVSMVIQHTG
jgi:hypothetical protein